MRKVFFILSLFVILTAQAESPLKKKLMGVWKLQWMEMTGIKMEHSQMGEPFMEFNEEGGFLVKVGGKNEKGRYSVKGDEIRLNFIYPKKPVQKLTITKLDTQELDYTTTDSGKVIKVTCYRINTGPNSEKD